MFFYTGISWKFNPEEQEANIAAVREPVLEEVLSIQIISGGKCEYFIYRLVVLITAKHHYIA